MTAPVWLVKMAWDVPAGTPVVPFLSAAAARDALRNFPEADWAEMLIPVPPGVSTDSEMACLVRLQDVPGTALC